MRDEVGPVPTQKSVRGSEMKRQLTESGRVYDLIPLTCLRMSQLLSPLKFKFLRRLFRPCRYCWLHHQHYTVRWCSN